MKKDRHLTTEVLEQHREECIRMVKGMPRHLLIEQLLITFRVTQGDLTDQLRAIIVNELNEQDGYKDRSYQFLRIYEVKKLE